MPSRAPAQARSARVLRVGLVVDGKLRDQRLIRQQAPVTAGESADSTLLAPLDAQVTLFRFQDGVPVLQIGPDMRGRISGGEGATTLSRLRRDPRVTTRAGVHLVPLAATDRGKIELPGGVTILFQMAPPPPTPLVADNAVHDFRPRLLDQGDPTYLAALSGWTAMAGVFLAVAATSTPAPVGLDDLPEAVRKQVFLPPELVSVAPPEPEIEPETPKPAPEEPPPEPTPETVADVEPAPDARVEAMRERDLLEELAQRSEFIKHIRGRHSGNSVFDGPDDSLAAVDGLLDDLDGRQVAIDKPSGPRDGTTDTEDADIELRKASTGVTTLDETGTGVPHRLHTEPPTLPDDTDAGLIADVIRRQQGAMSYCFQQASRNNSELRGRVAVEFALEGGSPVDAGISFNGTGSEALGDCIVDKLRRWRFGRVDTQGAMVEVPFVFSPK